MILLLTRVESPLRKMVVPVDINIGSLLLIPSPKYFEPD